VPGGQRRRFRSSNGPRSPAFAANSLRGAGNPDTVAPWAIGSVTKYESGGYIAAGASRRAGRSPGAGTDRGAPATAPSARFQSATATGPGGCSCRPARTGDGVPIANNLQTDVKFPTDVFNIRPVRKAVLEKREAAEERAEGGEGHGKGGAEHE